MQRLRKDDRIGDGDRVVQHRLAVFLDHPKTLVVTSLIRLRRAVVRIVGPVDVCRGDHQRIAFPPPYRVTHVGGLGIRVRFTHVDEPADVVLNQLNSNIVAFPEDAHRPRIEHGVRHPVLAVQLAIVRQRIVCGIQLGTALRVRKLQQRPCEPGAGVCIPATKYAVRGEFFLSRPRRVDPFGLLDQAIVGPPHLPAGSLDEFPAVGHQDVKQAQGVRVVSRHVARHANVSQQVAGLDPHVLQTARVRSELQFPIDLGAGLIHHPELCPGMGIAPEDLHDLTLQFEHFRLVKERIGHAAVVGLQSERKHRKKRNRKKFQGSHDNLHATGSTPVPDIPPAPTSAHGLWHLLQIGTTANERWGLSPFSIPTP